MNSGGVCTMSTVCFPVYSTAIFKVLNRLDFMSLQRQDVCLQSKLLTFCTLFSGFCCCFTVFEYVVKRGVFVHQCDSDIVKE